MSAPSGYDLTQIQQFTPEQMRFFKKVWPQLGSGAMGGLDMLSRMAAGDEDLFADIEKPYYSALERGLGQTASRFSQMGAQDSSAFQMAQAAQANQLAEQLGAQRMGLQQGAIDRLLAFAQQMLGARPFEQQLTPSWQSQLMSGLGTGIGNIPSALASYYGMTGRGMGGDKGVAK